LYSEVLQRLFKNVDVENKDLVQPIVAGLLKLLMALCVEASPEHILHRIEELWTPLEKYLLLLLSKDARISASGKAILDACRVIAFERSLHGLKDLSSGDVGSGQWLEILDATLDLFLPFIPSEMKDPLFAILKVAAELKYLVDNPSSTVFAARAPRIIEYLSIALCVPRHNIAGVVALAQGDWQAAADLCRPFCNLDAEWLDQITKLLPSVINTVDTREDLFSSTEDIAEAAQFNSHLASRVQQIAANAMQGKGSAGELFELVDLDKNGYISQEEFLLLMNRLDFDLNSHRVAEIMSTCKKKIPKTQVANVGTNSDAADGLSEEEFKEALKYLEGKVAINSMTLMNLSWARLMVYLLGFTLILVFLFVFIFFGMAAFISGGVFSSVVNSIMTISAGLGLSKAGEKTEKKKDEGNTSMKDLVEEVKTTVFGNE